MAPGRIALGGIAAAAASIVLAVAGCGGGSSSAPGTTGGGPATAPSSAASRPAGGSSSGATGKTEKESASKAAAPGHESTPGKSVSRGNDEKKHPPLELPTGKPESGPTKAQQERVPTADIKVTIPTGLTGANTCKGKNVSPAISWQNVPPGTAELAIFAVSVQPVDGKLYFDWALAGVDPELPGLKSGQVPKGAVLGRNSAGRNGYAICPTGSSPETYIFSVYALPSSLSAKPGFDPLTLRKQASAASEEVGLTAATFKR